MFTLLWARKFKGMILENFLTQGIMQLLIWEETLNPDEDRSPLLMDSWLGVVCPFSRNLSRELKNSAKKLILMRRAILWEWVFGRFTARFLHGALVSMITYHRLGWQICMHDPTGAMRCWGCHATTQRRASLCYISTMTWQHTYLFTWFMKELCLENVTECSSYFYFFLYFV